nr:MAG: replication initiator protein [Microvirus sp.]
MTCTSPFKLQGKEGAIHLLPCGYCMACRIARNREWAARLLHEKTLHKNAVFLTLTFAPENIPPFDSLSKDTLQKFLKRLRKSLVPRKIRYFASGEYGETHGHAHYHLIVFGLSNSISDKELTRKAWPYGFIYSGSVTYSSCRYVTAYILKKVVGDKATDEYGDCVPPFALMSKGLGRGYVEKNFEQFKNADSMTIDGKHFALPRYYKSIQTLQDTPDGLVSRPYLDIDKQAIKSKAIQIAHDKIAEYEKRGLLTDDDRGWSIDKAREEENKQKALNIQAKTNHNKIHKL